MDLSKVLNFDRRIFSSDTKDRRRLRFLVALRQFFAKLPQPPSEPKDFLFVISMHRPDYYQLFDVIVRQCNHSKAEWRIELGTKGFRLSSLVDLPVAIWTMRSFRGSLAMRAYLSLRYLTYVRCTQRLQFDLFGHIVSFSDMQPLDNCIIQTANEKGIPTTTLQHGLYVDYTGYDNVNEINYQNIVSSTFLAWGEETSSLVKKHHPSVDVVICGKPTLREQPDSSSCCRFFTVIFDQNLFHKENVRLLEIAHRLSDETGLPMALRLHPHNKRQWFKIDESKVIEMPLHQSAFVIGHTSSMIYECLRLGVPAFRFKTDVPANDVTVDIEFENSEELLQMVDRMEYDPREIGRYYVREVETESMACYRKYFDEAVLQRGSLLNGSRAHSETA